MGGVNAAANPVVDPYMYGNSGDPQYDASLAVQPDGSFVTAWTVQEEYSDGTYANDNIVFRNFTETKDSVGPVLEGLEDSSGLTVSTPTIATTGTIDTPTNTVILTFDEDMMTTGLDSVTNPANYELLDNGTVVPGGISEIDFGMNRGYDWAQANGGTSWVPTNKWEAVLTLNQTLPSGAYSIKVLAPARARAASRIAPATRSAPTATRPPASRTKSTSISPTAKRRI